MAALACAIHPNSKTYEMFTAGAALKRIGPATNYLTWLDASSMPTPPGLVWRARLPMRSPIKIDVSRPYAYSLARYESAAQ